MSAARMPSQSSLRPRTAAGEKTCAMRSPVFDHEPVGRPPCTAPTHDPCHGRAPDQPLDFTVIGIKWRPVYSSHATATRVGHHRACRNYKKNLTEPMLQFATSARRPNSLKRLTRYQATVLLSSGMHFLRLAAPFLALVAASLSF